MPPFHTKLLKALLVMDPGAVPSRCFGCTLHCPVKATVEARPWFPRRVS